MNSNASPSVNILIVPKSTKIDPNCVHIKKRRVVFKPLLFGLKHQTNMADGNKKHSYDKKKVIILFVFTMM